MVPNAFRLLPAVAALIAACSGGDGRGSFDIETARNDGKVSTSEMTGFTLTRVSRTAEDDYVRTLDYVTNATVHVVELHLSDLADERRKRHRRDAFTMTVIFQRHRGEPRRHSDTRSVRLGSR
jgi:hypothetical protein